MNIHKRGQLRQLNDNAHEDVQRLTKEHMKRVEEAVQREEDTSEMVQELQVTQTQATPQCATSHLARHYTTHAPFQCHLIPFFYISITNLALERSQDKLPPSTLPTPHSQPTHPPVVCSGEVTGQAAQGPADGGGGVLSPDGDAARAVR
jgi:hypothetical protein